MSCGTVAAKGDDMLMNEFTATASKVRTGETTEERMRAAKHLFELTKGKRPKELDDKTIMSLASLLDGADDPVRYWVARCIGNFGRRARIAAPRLEQVLAEVECLVGSKTSASGIEFALSQMGIKPPDSKCN
jgi:hypothetical protein